MGLFNNPPDDKPAWTAEPHWCWSVNLYTLSLDETPGDSNEVVCAKAVLRVYREKDSFADEMSYKDIDLVNSLPIEAAFEVLRERELL